MLPAPNEIYTYCATLSFHDALPISSGMPGRSFSWFRVYRLRQRIRFEAGDEILRIRRLLFGRGTEQRVFLDRTAGALRSEEHTSELQSLMRISYAVFCLKKKNKRTIQRT